MRVLLSKLSDALAASAIETRRDVLSSEIEVSGYFVFAYQLVGQPRSIMVPDQILEPRRVAESPVPSEAQLSKQLGQPVIQLIVSDTSSVIGYALFEGVEMIEGFTGLEDESTDCSNEYSQTGSASACSVNRTLRIAYESSVII